MRLAIEQLHPDLALGFRGDHVVRTAGWENSELGVSDVIASFWR